jgi:hypothetical protein
MSHDDVSNRTLDKLLAAKRFRSGRTLNCPWKDLELANLNCVQYGVYRGTIHWTFATKRNARMSQSNGHMTPDQISFYDEVLKKQIEGSYRYDGKWIYVASQAYGARTAHRGGIIDVFALNLFAQKVLSELARDAEEIPAESHSYKKAA